MRINTKLATLVHARDNESNESITDMTEGLPFFPLLCPRVSGSGNYLPCVIIIRGVKSRHTRVSRPSRGRCRPRFFHLRPVHSLGRCTRTRTRHTHTHMYTYREIRARRSPINSLRALQSEFSTLLPGMKLARNVSACG